jgi:hypothetical protein
LNEGKRPRSCKRATKFQTLRKVAKEHAGHASKTSQQPQLEHTPLVTDLSGGTEREEKKVSKETMEMITYNNHKMCHIAEMA